MDMPMGNSSSMSDTMMMMSMQNMEMVFFTADNTPLYSSSWKPNSTGTYAGTCIFLIVLTVIFRFLYAWKAVLERRWMFKSRQWNALTMKTGSDRIDVPTLPTQAMGSELIVPFRLSIDVPRALLFTVLLGVGYLLMLAVMTMNVGYFLSILGGGFLGELLFGRYASSSSAVEGHMCG